jgi:hypothetical protein
MLPTLAAFAIAYTFGEGLGRLACLSFGCCYGKELNSCSQPVRRLLHPFAPVFTGTTKKISYAGGASGVKVVPVQLMTCVLHVIVGITAIYLFSIELFGASLVLAITITQGWRFASELLRADYRGAGNFSAYQFMGLGAIIYTWLELLIPAGVPLLFSAKEGFDSFWSPQIILLLQSIWVAILLYTGLSKVTSSQVTFSIRRERI